MVSGKDPRARFRAEIASLGRWRTLARALVPLHVLLLLCLLLWVAGNFFSWVPALPLWAAFLPLPAGGALVLRHLGRKGRLDLEEARDLLQAALEVEASHPFAGSLALQAEAVLRARRKDLLGKAFRDARRPRPWYLLYALLAFLLLLGWTGPLPWGFPWSGSTPRPSGVSLAQGGGAGPGKRGKGEGKGRAPGRGGSGRDQARGARKSSPSRTRRPPRRENPPMVSRRGQSRGLRPKGIEKILFTPPAGGNGPKRLKKVYQTRGAPPLPGRETLPGARTPKRSPGRPGPSSLGRKGGEKAGQEWARAMERAAERALGDGFLSPGEAWLASRMAEAWKR